MLNCNARRKSGFVLLTVVLVSALLIVSSLMFVAQLMAETRITKTDAVFKNALSIAEAGLNTTLSEIKNSNSDTWAQRLQYMYEHPAQRHYDGATTPMASMDGTYTVDVDLDDASSLGGNQYEGTIAVDSTGVEFPPSVAAADMATSTDYSARRRVQTRATAVWTYVPSYVIPGLPAIEPTEGSDEVPEVGYWDTDEFGIGYGVFTGGDFSTQGSAEEINGDIYAGGNASIKKNSVSGGKVYAHGSVTGDPPTGSKSGFPSIPFPMIDTSYYQSLFTAYINGTFPYNTPFNQIPGAAAGTFYTCTAKSGPWTLQGGINRAVYGVGALEVLTSDVTIGGKTYKVIPSDNATAALTYMTNSTTSYFVSGDLHINAQVTLTGTVVVDGTIFVNGGANILAGTKMPALLATGDFVKNNGNATINGLVYTEGSFTGVGTADIVGALYARAGVDMNGNMSVTYDSSIDAVVVGATWVVTTPYQAAVDPTTGRAATPDVTVPDLYRVDDVWRLDQSGRSWVELAPGS